MKIAAFHYNGKPGVGLVSADLQQMQSFDLPLVQRKRGALALIEMQASGKALPAMLLPVKINEVRITAPLPKPSQARPQYFLRRQKLFFSRQRVCRQRVRQQRQGGRRYSGCPIYLTKVLESVIGPGDVIEMPSALSAID